MGLSTVVRERIQVRESKMGSELGTHSSIHQSLTNRYSDWIHEALDELPENFLITDPCLSGHPIVYASKGFLNMSGYSRDEIIGKNGRFFQGPDTDRGSVLQIREAIGEDKTLQISLLNYRKNGTPIWILFHLCPVFSEQDGRVVHFIGVQVPISKDSGSSHFRSITRSLSNNGFLYGVCRKEVYKDPSIDLDLTFVDSDNRGLQADEPGEAREHEKEKAISTINNILSKLAHYSKLMGGAVSGERCGFVSPLSTSLTIALGYSRHEVLGRNCRFLQGPFTDVEDVQKIREGIQSGKPCTVRILNYRKDTTSFWNSLHISPVRNSFGKVSFFVGVQLDEASMNEDQGLSSQMRQLGAVGAVKVAVRSLSGAGHVGPSKSQLSS
ncbi:protein TWIN LOV 1 isoform X2 [Amborella trichopoda]|uniref:protein TWIN LOV 1 isoform X2 n=1 Tax=Amborella trichopoda TaxID=13333 RepID=UPI0005D33FA5|nr:protein TWIN LOV 1 isoform X2 [Amborella trichopoda]|eukprot:XP_011622485.1 protein TWIN LOV 1 isoform X2 [Amborella trichopoda]